MVQKALYILIRVDLSQFKNVYMPGQREGKKSEGIEEMDELTLWED